MERITIGDDFRTRAWQCQLLLNGEPFVIAPEAVILAALVDEFGVMVLGPCTIDYDEIGTDLSISTVFFGPSAEQTLAATTTGRNFRLRMELTEGTVINTHYHSARWEIATNAP